MALPTRQKNLLMQSGTAKETNDSITLGVVVDTNDPQQMGRVRAVCVAWGDSYGTDFEDLPWCMYGAPFGGSMTKATRGPGIQETKGSVAYGMWAIPKVGAQILVACLDGDPMYRVYLGCIFDQLTPHTLPHGRYMYEDHDALEKGSSDAKPQGPYSSEEKFIEPLNTNQKRAFGNHGEPSFEWRNRGADYTVARVNVDELDYTESQVQDDLDIDYDDWISTQGYGVSRQNPFGTSSLTNKNYDSPVYSITTPGFHSLSMDDRMENARIRLRTTSGHQILMDDTNERIYIQTAKGNNWIEIDENGTIDIYSTNRINIRSAEDMNFTSDKTIRFTAQEGIHMYTPDEIRMHAKKDINVLTEQNIRAHSLQSTYLQADQNIQFKAGTSYYLNAAQEINEKCGSDLKLSSGSTIHLNAGVDILETAARDVHMQGPAATVASNAEQPNEQKAFWTSRVPDHEPWARTSTKDNFTHEPEFPYDSKAVNRSDRGMTYVRGRYWRR